MASNHPTIPQINLLPDVKISLIKARMQRNIMVSVSILITVVCGVIMFILTSTLTTLAVVKNVADGNIKNYSDKIVKEQRTGELNEYMTIQNQLDQISKLKKTQENFSLIFDYLAKLNPTGANGMTIGSFHINSLNQSSNYSDGPVGTITLQAKTSSYAALNVIKLTMQKAKIHYRLSGDDSEHVEQIFNEVGLSGVSATAEYSGNTNGNTTKTSRSGQLSFSLTLKYNPVIFAYNITNTSIEVPHETISDSRDNTPGASKKLFDGKTNSDLSNGSKQKKQNKTKKDNKKDNKSDKDKTSTDDSSSDTAKDDTGDSEGDKQ